MTEEEKARVFADEFEPLFPELRKIAMGWLQSEQDADDLVQDTMLRIWTKIHLYTTESPLGWAITIMKRTNIDRSRRRRLDTTPLDESAYFLEDGLDVSELASSRIDAAREIDHLWADLNEDSREVMFRLSNGQSAEEVAQAMGVQVGTVHSRTSRARAKVAARG